jgi:NAD(P)-dependent dehydrogenase (short-subunit alcohol dehydrogenase family)
VDLGIAGKVAVVTGASRGIGRAIVEALAGEGVRVVAGARSDVGAEPVVDGVTSVAVDLATPDGPRRLVEQALSEHGTVDILVNNVGAARLHLDGFATATDADWQWAFDINIMSHVRAIRAALPALAQSRGTIVNVSSLNARIPAVEAPEYSAMKAALNSITRGLALELAPDIRVNSVSPGPVLTDMQRGIAEQIGQSVDDYVATVNGAVPLKRFATTAEVAAMVLAAASPRFGYTTGADLTVDGAVQGG